MFLFRVTVGLASFAIGMGGIWLLAGVSLGEPNLANPLGKYLADHVALSVCGAVLAIIFGIAGMLATTHWKKQRNS